MLNLILGKLKGCKVISVSYTHLDVYKRQGQFNLWNNVRYIVEKSQIGSSVVDFGRGGYDYKMQNFRPQVENLYRFMASKTKWGNWYVLFKIAASHMRKTLKKYKG